MEKADGSNAPKNADTVSELSWKTTRRNTMTAITKRTTGEPCNAKVLSTVRWGTMGKGPDNWYLACSLPNYQQGALAGYEVREYLLEKWGRMCAYCDAKDVSLQVEHIVCRARGGSNRLSNFCLACEPCNRKKGTQDIAAFLQHDPARLAHILAQAKAPLRDAAAVNTTRWVLFERLKTLGLPIECGSGGLTKYNRIQRGLSKAHWIDAACVGKSTPDSLCAKGITPLLITAKGHGSRQMCRMNKWGFPRTGPKAAKRVKGFQTGDIVRAVVPTGKYTGRYIGRVAVRLSGSFDVTTANAKVQGISYRFCSVLHRCDGYEYRKGGAAFLMSRY